MIDQKVHNQQIVFDNRIILSIYFIEQRMQVPKKDNTEDSFEDLTKLDLSTFLKDVNSKLDKVEQQRKAGSKISAPNQDFQQQKNQLTDQVAKLKKENSEMLRKIQDLKEEIKLTQSLWKDENKAKKDLEEDNGKLLEELAKLKKEKTAIEGKLKYTEQQLEQEKKVKDASSQMLKQMLDQREIDLKKLEDKVQSYESTIDELRSKIASQANDSNKSEQMAKVIDQLRYELDEQRSSNSKIVEKLNQELSELREKISLLENQLQTKSEQKNIQNKDIQLKLQSQIKEKPSEKEHTNRFEDLQLVQKDDEIEKLKVQLSKQTKTCESLNDYLQDTRSQVSVIRQELEQTKQLLSKSQQTNSELQEKLSGLELQAKKKREEEQTKAMFDLIVARRNLQDKDQMIKKLQEQDVKQKEELQKALSAKSQLEQKIAEIQLREKDSRNKLEALIEELKYTVASLTQKFDEKEAQMQNYKQQQSSSSQSTSDLQARIIEYCDRISELQRLIEQLECEKSSEQQQFSKLKQNSEKQMNEIHWKDNRITQLENQVKNFIGLVNTLTGEVQQAKANLIEAQEQVQSLSGLVQQLKSDKTDLSDKIASHLLTISKQENLIANSKNQTESSFREVQNLRKQAKKSEEKAIQLEERVNMYENPKSNKDRFEILRKWIVSKNFSSRDKILFINWTEQLFSYCVNLQITQNSDPSVIHKFNSLKDTAF